MLLKKHLTPELREELKNRVTPNGVTLDYVANSGMQNPDAKIGVYAGDEESYSPEFFGKLFDAIIADYHVFGPEDRHVSDLNPAHLHGAPNLDPDGSFIISTRIRVARNPAGFAFTPAISAEKRLEVERLMVSALESLSGDLAGTYHPITGMDEETRKQLVEEHLLFRDDDKHVADAGIYRDWAEGRGVFLSHDRKFGVWVSEEDQRIFSLEDGADLSSVFDRLCRAALALEDKVPFAKHSRYGYLTSCPTNVGTGMRASVMIKLPKISRDEKAFKELCLSMGLQARGMHGEHSESGAGGIYDISNKQRLGKSEAELIQILHDGILKLIEMEREAPQAAAA